MSQKHNVDIPPRHRPFQPAILAISLAVIVLLIHVPGISRLLGPLWALVVYDLIVAGAAIYAAFLATHLWRAHERGEKLSLVWGCIAAGLILWALGEIIWSSDQLWGGNSLPYPSMADVFWILGYFPLIFALGLRYYMLGVMPNKGWQIASLAVYLGLFGLAVWMILLPIYTDADTTRVFEKTVNLLYPIGDLIVGFLAAVLLMVLIGGTLFRSWGLVALGLFCAAVSDLLYTWAIWQGTFEVNPAGGTNFGSAMINVLYAAFYLFVAVGLFRQARSKNAI